MAEIEVGAEMYGVEYLCDKCGAGNMRPAGGAILMSEPPKFPHKCSNCDFEAALADRYPTVRFRIATTKQSGGGDAY